jgi:hypothetical protein
VKDPSVVIAASSLQRREAIDAVSFAIDAVKSWKKVQVYVMHNGCMYDNNKDNLLASPRSALPLLCACYYQPLTLVGANAFSCSSLLRCTTTSSGGRTAWLALPSIIIWKL